MAKQMEAQTHWPLPFNAIGVVTERAGTDSFLQRKVN